MKAYPWPSVANNSLFHKAKKELEAAIKMDLMKAWKAMRTLEKGLQHHHSCAAPSGCTNWMRQKC
eukprot:9843179-Ditylum_brightwellii.AAC.1